MTDQMSTDALELYCRNRAKSIGELTEYDRLLLMDVSERLCSLQSENAELQANVTRMEAEHAADLLERGSKPNDPLTLEELRGMDREPVFIKNIRGKQNGEWKIIRFVTDNSLEFTDGTARYIPNSSTFVPCYGKTWLAYRRKPEGGGE